jgi:hypothetical protein
MNANHELDRLLGELAAQNSPALPAGFRHGVWREIRRRRDARTAAPFPDSWNWLLASVLRPRPVTAALALALLLGPLAGLSFAPQPGHAVRLDAFSASAPGLFLSLSTRTAP